MIDALPSLFDEGPPPPCPVRFNLAAHVLAAADRVPDKIALTVVQSANDPVPETLTYADLRTRVLQAAGGLAAHGVQQGDRVILRIGHSTDFPIFFLAAAAIGAVPVPTSTLLSVSELRHIAEETEAQLILAHPDIVPDGIGCTDPARVAGPAAAFADTTADDLAYIVYTSGSSGRPKGVAHAHRAVWARQMMWQGWYGMDASDTILHAGAFNWTYTLGAGLMDPWAMGAATVIYAGPRDPGVWPAIAAAHQVTIFAAAPGVYRQLLKSEAPMDGFANLRHGLSAGETMAAPIRNEWAQRTGKPIYEALGMTEVSTFISSSPASPPRKGAAGRPQPGRRVAILPVEGGDTPVQRHTPGIIAVNRTDPGLMMGYWRNEAETEAVMRGDWFLTGDIGVMDEDGYIAFHGRGDDQMNALGYRVAPEEVEAALMLHPAITGAAAVELPVRADLSIIAAFVTVEGQANEAAIITHAAAHLAAYKVPKQIRILPDLPRNPNGKLRRRDLIATYGFKSADSSSETS